MVTRHCYDGTTIETLDVAKEMFVQKTLPIEREAEPTISPK